jgi:ubiquitin thioesterase protein OTUB1
LAQEKQIEKEIAESIPLVGRKLEIIALINEYSNDDQIYQQKVLVTIVRLLFEIVFPLI